MALDVPGLKLAANLTAGMEVIVASVFHCIFIFTALPLISTSCVHLSLT